jgi:hypothetical protein
MALNTPPLKAPPATIADWVEVRTLADTTGSFRLTKLKRFWDTQRETEDSDPSGQFRREEDTEHEGVGGGDDDAFLDSVTNELAERDQALGGTYPFVIAASGLKLELKRDLDFAQHIYLFCLLLTHSRAGEILDGSWLPPIDNKVRDLFQACSTVAAAGEVRGCAISFGWPRPHKNPSFLKKLQEVYALMGEGKPVKKPKRGASPMVKDEEIDIIAWRPRLDGAAGKTYLLGQVASGENWEPKSIKGGPIDFFHVTWFTTPPVSAATPSIFIPHAVPPVGEGTRRDRIGLITARYGSVIDRLRLPLLARDGEALARLKQDGWMIERVENISQITAWVKTQMKAIRKTPRTSL